MVPVLFAQKQAVQLRSRATMHPIEPYDANMLLLDRPLQVRGGLSRTEGCDDSRASANTKSKPGDEKAQPPGGGTKRSQLEICKHCRVINHLSWVNESDGRSRHSALALERPLAGSQRTDQSRCTHSSTRKSGNLQQEKVRRLVLFPIRW